MDVVKHNYCRGDNDGVIFDCGHSKLMKSVSEYNQTKKFTYEMRESRLIKCSRIIASLKPGAMLDVGCSQGDWAAHWLSRGWRCAGVDIDLEHVNAARQKGIDARTCDLNNEPLPFPDAGFDLIFAGEVIEHLIDTDGFISELSRCLVSGGHLLLTTPNLASFENRVRLLLGIYPAWLNYNLSGSGHVRGYTPRVLRKQLLVHGFTVVLHKGNWVPFIPQRFLSDIKFTKLSITGDVLPSLSMDTIMLARKDGL